MGLFAAMLVLSCRFPAPTRGRLRITAIQVLVASMLPMAFESFGMVDYGAHLGGAIAGGRAALLLLTLWPNDATGPARTAQVGRPRLAFLATLIAAIGIAGAAYGATRVPHDHKLQSYAALLFPRDRLPATDDAAKTAAAALIATHPRDPRGHFYHALALIDAKNLSDAEDELRTALGDGELLQLMFKPAFAQRMEMLLSLVLLEQRKTDRRQAGGGAGLRARQHLPRSGREIRPVQPLIRSDDLVLRSLALARRLKGRPRSRGVWRHPSRRRLRRLLRMRFVGFNGPQGEVGSPACLACRPGRPPTLPIPGSHCAPASANREGLNDLGSVRLFSAARAGRRRRRRSFRDFRNTTSSAGITTPSRSRSTTSWRRRTPC